MLLAWLAATVRAAGADAELTVYAAASLRDALHEIAGPQAAGARIVFNFGSSGTLARQILAADRADVFFSADDREMDRLAAAGRIDASTRKDLLSNQLVVIEPEGAPSPFAEPFTARQLASGRVRRLALAHPAAVPAGRYARAWLASAGVWDAVAERVLPGVDVRATLAAVERGGADAGIVYATDAATSRKVRVVHRVPVGEGPRIVYPVAAVAHRSPAARAFVERLASPAARAVFERHGFLARDCGIGPGGD